MILSYYLTKYAYYFIVKVDYIVSLHWDILYKTVFNILIFNANAEQYSASDRIHYKGAISFVRFCYDKCVT